MSLELQIYKALRGNHTQLVAYTYNRTQQEQERKPNSASQPISKMAKSSETLQRHTNKTLRGYTVP